MSLADALPPLRPELRIVGKRLDVSGADVSVLYDPVQHRFFEMGLDALALLEHWRCGSRAALMAAATKGNALVRSDDIDALFQFLLANQLLAIPRQPRPMSWFHRLELGVGRLLFFRIPLLAPDRVLSRGMHLLGPLVGRATVLPFLAFAALGLLILLRDWNLVAESLRPVFSVGGATSVIIAIIFAKSLHELGHAVAAKHMGCAVPSMGIAMVFGAPLLYTDLSDTWRLARRRDRLLVAAGGILAELMLACVATWGWLLLPDGPARSACFFLATVAWVTTLVVNLNPFMRFDGYFMLADLVGVPNLQPRSFAYGRWWLRRVMLGLPEAPPEELSGYQHAALLAYAYVTWLFRLSLYLGLSWYALSALPHVISFPLVASELWLLLVRPFVQEMRLWWSQRRAAMAQPRALLSLSILLLLIAGGFVPQRFTLDLPAVIAPADRQWIHPQRPSLLRSMVASGTRVSAGEVLAVFEDPELAHDIATSRLRLEALRLGAEQAARGQAASRELAVREQQIASENANLDGLLAQNDSLVIKADFNGQVLEADPSIVPGRWVSPADPLFLLASETGRRIVGYVDDRDISMVHAGAVATFYPRIADYPVIATQLDAVASLPSETINEPLLASSSGGDIATETDSARRAIPKHGQYRVTAPAGRGSPTGGMVALPGHLSVKSTPQSLFSLMLRRVQAFIVKQSSS